MPYDPTTHHRRSIRLRSYDYATPNPYFATICTHNRELSLVRLDVATAVERTWHALPNRFDNLELDEFIVMPNHIHGIVVITGERGASLKKIMRAFKSLSAIEANRILDRSEHPFWQRGYYERTVRSDRELDAVREYIRNNPAAWDEDPENPARLLQAASHSEPS